MTFKKDGYVWVEPLNISNEIFYNLEDGLVLFFTGFERSASSILEEQDKKTSANDSDMTKNLDDVKQMGYDSKEALEKGDLHRFADIMNVHWEKKKKRSANMSNDRINARRNGAMGGKLIGAGGGGFLMFYTEEKVRLREAMRKTGLSEVRFRFERQGTKVVF